ncbi:hypothetical protein IG193_01245 [Infirmifilum lucidum]|uniref:Uncharacterized protein n=1 Tax=Infirmifilum lucidum TaxID=2776706 RepID=A0A7L9FHJ1_9CREN|nr:hypothetical protein [Infirmifilum lucidum]QOJ79121.1 hypothetical protein IG193_01245 [Infirmifilum lucidum]
MPSCPYCRSLVRAVVALLLVQPVYILLSSVLGLDRILPAVAVMLISVLLALLVTHLVSTLTRRVASARTSL